MLCSSTFHPRITIQLQFTIQCSGIRYDAMRYEDDSSNDSPCCAYTNGAYSTEHKHKQHHSISSAASSSNTQNVREMRQTMSGWWLGCLRAVTQGAFNVLKQTAQHSTEYI